MNKKIVDGISKLSMFSIAMMLLLAIITPATAITYGTQDGDDHPYVGLAVFDDSKGPAWRCSGTLISPTVFLTAGHCTSGAVAARVWFDPDVTDAKYPKGGGTSIEGTPHTHQDFNGFASFPNIHDVGVVILNKPVIKGTYGVLPGLGILDSLATQRGQQEQTFTVVGYGLQSIKPQFQADRVRYQAVSKLVNLRSALTDGYNIQLSNNPGNDKGGTCFGDSGGPVFIEDTNAIAAVTSFGLNANCKGTDFGFRIDSADAQDFIKKLLD